ncbi:MAG TPA: branched-chain amino acid ABC transporter permease [Mycobacteriales bacterium]|nr:branched-chain amino acid ABC transporter permease [Mycobacteriales bacterium]
MSGQEFWNFTVVGLVSGSIYAVIALGYTLVYGVLQLINFAHSEVFMLGSMGGLFMARALLPAGSPSVVQSVGIMVAGLVVGALSGGAAAFALERTAYRPLRRRGAPKLAYLISAIGASLFASNLAGKEFGRQDISLSPVFDYNHVVFTIFGAAVRALDLVIIGVGLLMLLFLDRLVAVTRLGQSIRAVAQDAETASLMGVNVERVIITTFVLGGLLAGAGGFLYAAKFSASYNMGFLPGITAFSAAVLGGIGNVRGAVLGGLLLGLVKSYSTKLIGAGYVDVVGFLALVLVLLIRPSGLLGERLGRAA